MTISDIIRARLAMNPAYGTATLARELGCSEALVSKIKHGKRNTRPQATVNAFNIELVIRERIEQLRPDISSLGRLAGVHPQCIHRWLRRQQKTLDTPLLFAIAEALGIRFQVEYLNVDTLPARHPARRLTFSNGGRSRPRSVWTGEVQPDPAPASYSPDASVPSALVRYTADRWPERKL